MRKASNEDGDADLDKNSLVRWLAVIAGVLGVSVVGSEMLDTVFPPRPLYDHVVIGKLVLNHQTIDYEAGVDTTCESTNAALTIKVTADLVTSPGTKQAKAHILTIGLPADVIDCQAAIQEAYADRHTLDGVTGAIEDEVEGVATSSANPKQAAWLHQEIHGAERMGAIIISEDYQRP